MSVCTTVVSTRSLLPSSNPMATAACTNSALTSLSVYGVRPGERPVERIVLGHRLAVEIREPAQRASVSNPFAQFAIIPVLDQHQDQRTQDLLRRQPLAT